MRAVLAIAATNLRRLLRDRSNAFFVFAFPLILLLVLGTVFGEPEIRLGFVGPEAPLADQLHDDLDSLTGVSVTRYDRRDGAAEDLGRGDLEAFVILPEDFDETTRDGGPSTITFAATPDAGPDLRGLVDGAVAQLNARVTAALVAVGFADTEFSTALVTATELQGADSQVTVQDSSGDAFQPTGGFDRTAGQELVLFVFLTGMAAASNLIQTRKLGVSRRMLAAPLGTGQVLLGEAAGRYAVTLFQGLFIAVASAVLFGVEWGDLVATAALVALFALVAAAAAMVLGAVASNDSQASGIAVPFSLALAAIGGSMVPLEAFPDTIRSISRITPHSWANEAFTTLIADRGGLADIAVELAVLAGFAAVLLSVAVFALDRALR